MSASKDWLPHARTEQLNMAKVWLPVLTAKKTAWSIPQTVVDGLQPLITAAETILAQLDSPDRTTVITAEANRIFGELASHLRFIKDRYIKTPPLVAEDYPSLLLNLPDTTRTPRGDPKAQMTAEIHRSGTDMLILAYHYAEGCQKAAGFLAWEFAA